jgi:hypothetical protein
VPVSSDARAGRAADRSRRGTLAASAIYLVLTLVMTWPLARSIGRELPADLADPLLNAWIIAWDADHLLQAATGHLTALAEYWNANIYYPQPLALAYSEHLTAQALMILPVHALARNPILDYNLAFLATFFLSALGMFLFIRAATGSLGAAFVAGLAFGFAPYRFSTFPHIQVLSSMWMPFALLGFHRFLESRRTAPLVGAAAAWLAQNLSCGYYLLFFSPALALYLGLEIVRRRLWSDRRVWLGLVAAALVVAAGTAPFLFPYWRLRNLGFSPRSIAETIRYSADVLAYATADINMWLWGHRIRAYPRPEGSLFPGFVVVFLALAAIVSRWRSEPAPERTRPHSWLVRTLVVMLALSSATTLAILIGWPLRARLGSIEIRLTSLDRGLVIVAVLIVALAASSVRIRRSIGRWLASPVSSLVIVTVFAFTLSLGPQIVAHGRLVEETNLYALFYNDVPGFDGLRVPARAGMVVVCGLTALAGFGVAGLRRQSFGVVAVALIAVALIAEGWAAPIGLNENSTDYKQPGLVALPATLPTEAELPPIYRTVAQLPPTSAIIELPFGEVAFETRYMYYSTFHWRRLVNGYSGGAPAEYGLRVERIKDLLVEPEQAWNAVREARPTHILVHEASYAGTAGARISAWAAAHGAKEVAVSGGDHLFAITP